MDDLKGNKRGYLYNSGSRYESSPNSERHRLLQTFRHNRTQIHTQIHEKEFEEEEDYDEEYEGDEYYDEDEEESENKGIEREEDDDFGHTKRAPHPRRNEVEASDINRKLLDLIKSRKTNKKKQRWVKQEIVSALKNPSPSGSARLNSSQLMNFSKSNRINIPTGSRMNQDNPSSGFASNIQSAFHNELGALKHPNATLLKSNHGTEILASVSGCRSASMTEDGLNSPRSHRHDILTSSSADSQKSITSNAGCSEMGNPETPDTPTDADSFPWNILNKPELYATSSSSIWDPFPCNSSLENVLASHENSYEHAAKHYFSKVSSGTDNKKRSTGEITQTVCPTCFRPSTNWLDGDKMITPSSMKPQLLPITSPTNPMEPNISLNEQKINFLTEGFNTHEDPISEFVTSGSDDFIADRMFEELINYPRIPFTNE